MAVYPSGIKSFTDQVDFAAGPEGDADAVDVNVVYDEVEAIETELGTLPKGSYADVKTRLLALLDVNSPQALAADWSLGAFKLIFGGDANIYRSAAGLLKTDTNFQASKIGIGQAPGTEVLETGGN